MSSDPVWLWGVVILASAAGGDATLYQGQDAGSGDVLGSFKGAANVSNPVMFPRPVYCDRGLYLSIGSNITNVILLFKVVDNAEYPMGEVAP